MRFEKQITFTLIIATVLSILFAGPAGLRAQTLTIPNSFTPGSKIVSSEMNANFNAIKSVVNGNIASDNIATGSIIDGNIATGTITLAKLANISSTKLLGRSTSGAGIPEEIAVGTGLTLTGQTLTAQAYLTKNVLRLSSARASTDGYGTQWTMVRRFQSVVENTGSDFSYNGGTSASGSVVTILVAGSFCFHYQDKDAATCAIGIAVNANGATDVTSLDGARILGLTVTSSGIRQAMSTCYYFATNDIVTFHTNSNCDGTSENEVRATMVKVSN